MKPVRRWLVWLAVAAVCCAVLAYGTSRNQVAGDVAAIQSLGIPVDEEALRQVHLGSGEDAGPLYKEFADHYKQATPEDKDAFRNVRLERIRISDHATQSVSAKSLRAFTQLFAKATEHPSWSIGTTDEDESVMGASNSFAQTLNGIALAEWRAGNLDESLSALRALNRHIEHLDQNPGVHRSWLDDDLAGTYRSILFNSFESPAKLQKLIGALSHFRKEPDRRYALLQHVFTSMEDFKTPSQYIERQQKASTLEKYLAQRSRKAKIARDIKMWRTAFEQFPKDHLTWKEARDILQSIYNKVPPEDPEYEKPWRRFDSTIKLGIEECNTWGSKVAAQRALIMQAQLELIRIETGKYPAALPVDGTNSLDPFSEKPMSYLLTKDGGYLLRYGTQATSRPGRQYTIGLLR